MFSIQFVFLLCLQIVYVFGMPKWSDNYHIKGVLSIPESGIHEPFEAWYSKELKRSRIDFYRGMDQTFQSLADRKFGIGYKIFPYTDEVNLNIEACLSTIGTAKNPVKLQPILYPVEDLFKFAGEEELNGQLVQKWTHYETDNEITLDFTFYIKCEKRSFREMLCKPVRLEMIGANVVFPSHVGNYYIDFNLYEPDVVTKEMVRINFPVCHDISTLYMDTSFSFNPISEFLPNIANFTKGFNWFDSYAARHAKRFHNYKQQFKNLVNIKQNRDYVLAHNRKRSSYKLAVNSFAGFSEVQLAAYNKRLRKSYFPQIKKSKQTGKRKLLKSLKTVKGFHYSQNDLKQLSKYKYYNIHDTGAMNPVQAQLNCGSCWAFATAAALEGAYFKKYNRRIKLSEQALIDCSWGFKNLGCDGGMETFALDWIMKHNGLPITNEYGGYLANNGYCGKKNHSETVRVKRYEVIASGDIEAIQIALLKNGPVLTSMQAGIKSVALYSHGIYNNVNCKSDIDSLDHAVVIVGFGHRNNKLYWIVRNSWSSTWGSNGHMLVAADNNICGLSTSPLVVYVE